MREAINECADRKIEAGGIWVKTPYVRKRHEPVKQYRYETPVVFLTSRQWTSGRGSEKGTLCETFRIIHFQAFRQKQSALPRVGDGRSARRTPVIKGYLHGIKG